MPLEESAPGMPEWDETLRYILVGDERVGKTSLLLRFAQGRFDPGQAVTVGVDFGSRIVSLGGRRVKILAWDTAGQERYRSIIRSYYRGAAVALLVYDATRRGTLDKLETWLGEVTGANGGDVRVVLVSNKADAVDREVSREEGEAFAAARGLTFVETSAKTGDGVEEAFLSAARALTTGATAEEAESRLGLSASETSSFRECCR